MKMDLIVGGGRYGTRCLDYAIRNGHGCIVIDPHVDCQAAREYDLCEITAEDPAPHEDGGLFFIRGDAGILPRLLDFCTFGYIFPTAPVHVAAAVVREKFGLDGWEEGIDKAAARLPYELIVSISGDTIALSHNPDGICMPECEAPAVCPVTGVAHPQPMHAAIRSLLPESTVLISHQLEPGIGALTGDELERLLAAAEGRSHMIIATACRCHGVITALRDAGIRA